MNPTIGKYLSMSTLAPTQAWRRAGGRQNWPETVETAMLRHDADVEEPEKKTKRDRKTLTYNVRR